ncbi:CPBP family intramembrane glutamic endopeptidase [Halobaculum lipolyticum]|uniref:CPBP family intramembrane glutamic endopeptidase n=1 Tax=Halobaculum lipolyticum TaxID=3032001 RepID=A0ABD5WC35_9EURY|nr:type II CAAX endopeptidase family protein [Halobaculum sp. DT31]
MSVELGPPGGSVEGRAVAVRVGQAVLAIVAGVVAASALVPAFEWLATALGFGAESAVTAAFVTVGNVAGFAVAGVVFLFYAGDLDLLRVRRPTARDAAVAVVGTVGLIVAGYAILFAFSTAGLTPSTNRALENPPGYFLLMIPLSFLAVAVGEEVLFRGVVQGELRRALGPAGAIVGASVLFGLLHYLAGTGTPGERLVYVAVAALLGVGLGAMYEYTGNLVVPVVVHGAYNAVQFAVQYLSATGAI